MSIEEGSKEVREHVVIGQYLLESLNKKKKGQDGNYNWIVSQLKNRNMTSAVMLKWLIIFKKYVTIVDDESIIKSILNFSWYTSPDSVLVDTYINYCLDLTSFHVSFINNVLTSLIKAALLPDHESESVYINIHRAIELQLTTNPKVSDNLLKSMELLSPYKMKSSNHQEVFVKCCLHISRYYSNIFNELLHLIILKMLQIDVEVSVLEHEEETLQFNTDDVAMAEEEKVCLSPRFCFHDNMEDKMADSIDVMMSVLFEFINELSYEGGQLSLDSACSLFQSFIKIFFNQICLTHKSSYVQFLLFKMTSFDKSFSEYFLAQLWENFQNVHSPGLLRQVLSCYLSSYLSRAQFIPLNLVKQYLLLISDWLHQYIDERVTVFLQCDISVHSVWYSLCQSLFYIIIFHHHDIIHHHHKEGLTFLRKLNIDRIITSKLNPLKVCLGSVVELFASIMSKYEIVYCYSVIEENKRCYLPVLTTPTSGNTSLETIFPFDPYHLKRSSKYLNGLYREWNDDNEGVVSADDNDSILIPSSVDSLTIESPN